MLILACILVFLSVTLLIGAFGSRMTLAHRRVAVERLGALQPTTYEETLAAGIASPGPSAPHWIARWFRSAGNEASPELKVVGLAPSSPTARLLLFAGFRSRSALRGFLLTRLATAIGFGVVGFLGAKQQASGPEELFAATVFLGLIGFLLPKMVLKLKARRRQHRLRLSLPDALDLLVVCVEAGMGLNQAIVRVSEELRSTHSEIADEFRLVNLEIRAGRSRADALRGMGERTGVDDIISLAAMIIQTDRFGTSIARSLRVHSDSLRTERRQRAEEAAAKTTIKLIFPLLFCIFPSLFVIILGPAALHLIKIFGNGGVA